MILPPPGSEHGYVDLAEGMKRSEGVSTNGKLRQGVHAANLERLSSHLSRARESGRIAFAANAIVQRSKAPPRFACERCIVHPSMHRICSARRPSLPARWVGKGKGKSPVCMSRARSESWSPSSVLTGSRAIRGSAAAVGEATRSSFRGCPREGRSTWGRTAALDHQQVNDGSG